MRPTGSSEAIRSLSVMSRLPVAAPTVPAPAPMAPPINAPLPPPANPPMSAPPAAPPPIKPAVRLPLAFGLTADLRGADRVDLTVQMNAVELHSECGSAFEAAGGMSFSDGSDSSRAGWNRLLDPSQRQEKRAWRRNASHPG